MLLYYSRVGSMHRLSKAFAILLLNNPNALKCSGVISSQCLSLLLLCAPLGQHEGPSVPDIRGGSGGAMPLSLEEEGRILHCSQIIHAHHGAVKPQNTGNAERVAAKRWKVGVAQPWLPFFNMPLVLAGPCHLHAPALAGILQAVSTPRWRPLVAGPHPKILASAVCAAVQQNSACDSFQQCDVRVLCWHRSSSPMPDFDLVDVVLPLPPQGAV